MQQQQQLLLPWEIIQVIGKMCIINQYPTPPIAYYTKPSRSSLSIVKQQFLRAKWKEFVRWCQVCKHLHLAFQIDNLLHRDILYQAFPGIKVKRICWKNEISSKLNYEYAGIGLTAKENRERKRKRMEEWNAKWRAELMFPRKFLKDQ